ncbi:MAG: hypothetical protein KME55_11070 [Nostoc indistinguendum CM1-VF10]|nr:hypothetical protein [Nostoc indistinguendum CM1-VF10]
MKVNQWVNQKFWKSIIIRLTPSVKHTGLIRVQHKRCLRVNLPYVYIYYDIDIAIAYGGRIRNRTKTSLEA